MKKIKTTLIVAILSMSLMFSGVVVFASNNEPQNQNIHAMDYLAKLNIVLDSKSYSGSTANSMPWGSSLTFRGEVYWDDGLLEIDNYAVVDWSLTDENGNKTQAWTKEWRGDDGIARIKIFAPYGITGKMKLTAVAIKNTSVSATQQIVIIDGTSKTGREFFRPYDSPVLRLPNKQIWDPVKGTYSMKLPNIPNFIKYGFSNVRAFTWITYFDETTPGVSYTPGSMVTISVDKYEHSDITKKFLAKIPQIFPPAPGKSISNVTAVSFGASVDLTWKPVKNANGYYIYKYNSSKKKYVKVATVKYRDSYMWSDRKTSVGGTYKYRVRPYKVVNGKKKNMKISYPVSVIKAYYDYSNALKVTISPSKAVTKKAGGTVKFKATAVGIPGEELISSSIRWYSSNKSVATVNKDGVVKLKKKGKCTIWAKAHNGKNSKLIKITVK